MRLINTTTFELKEFFNDFPHYAILSHRWEDGEVSFQDFQQGKGPSMKGWKKITGCCKRAKSDGWRWTWVDSCCIDKTSSAELSEAINSMFAWYKQAEICYAYLSDVVSDFGPQNEAEFSASIWFNRGWTLQELLAPRWVEFYNVKWKKIGTKSSLAKRITTRTGIAESFLFDYTTACVAQKMFWASTRQTTRVEDEAYCLMGLFDIHMPLLYGEDNKAFLRLQLEILKQADDDSVFAWQMDTHPEVDDQEHGLLASSPRQFRLSGLVKRRVCDEARPPIIITNKGLQLEVALIKVYKTDLRVLDGAPEITRAGFVRCVVLNCMVGSDDFIRLLLNVPYPYWGSESYNGSTNWTRRGNLGISKTVPTHTIRDTRFLLFAEALCPDCRSSQTQAPTNLTMELPSDFPYTLVSLHVPTPDLHGWSELEAAVSYIIAGFKGRISIIYFFERLTRYSIPGYEDLPPRRFGVLAIAEPFSVEILDIDDVQVIQKKRMSEYHVKDREPGDSTSICLTDGSMVYAAHKKAFLDNEYTYVISMSASGLIDNRASTMSNSRWLPFR